MSDKPDSALNGLLRLGVMGASLYAGWMGYRAYGPPVEQLPRLLSQLAQQAQQAWIVPAESPRAAQAESLFQAAGNQVAELQPIVPTDLPTANPSQGAMVPLHRPAPPPAAERLGRGLLVTGSSSGNLERLYAELRRLGAQDMQLAAWGERAGWHRFACSVPAPGRGGFVQHFDAVEASPAQAVQRVCQDLQQWRSQTLAAR